MIDAPQLEKFSLNSYITLHNEPSNFWHQPCISPFLMVSLKCGSGYNSFIRQPDQPPPTHLHKMIKICFCGICELLQSPLILSSVCLFHLFLSVFVSVSGLGLKDLCTG